jgi:hypothetical protein
VAKQRHLLPVCTQDNHTSTHARHGGVRRLVDHAALWMERTWRQQHDVRHGNTVLRHRLCIRNAHTNQNRTSKASTE